MQECYFVRDYTQPIEQIKEFSYQANITFLNLHLDVYFHSYETVGKLQQL